VVVVGDVTTAFGTVGRVVAGAGVVATEAGGEVVTTACDVGGSDVIVDGMDEVVAESRVLLPLWPTRATATTISTAIGPPPAAIKRLRRRHGSPGSSEATGTGSERSKTTVGSSAL
jgi:hypothetical protein